MKNFIKFLILSCVIVAGWSCIVCGFSYFIFGSPYVGMIEKNEWLFSVGMILSGIFSLWASSSLIIGVLKFDHYEEDITLKVFAFSFGQGELDFVCAVSSVSALKLLQSHINIPYEEIMSMLEDVDTVPPKEWKLTVIYDKNGDIHCLGDIMAKQSTEGYIGSSVWI